MAAVTALVTAGGKGTRMRDVRGEKPLVPLLGRPMIEWVLDAISSSGGVDRLCVSVSANAPLTQDLLEGRGFETIMTSGTDYVADLRQAMSHLRSRDVLICPADMPLLTPQGVSEVLDSYRCQGVASLSVAVALSVVRKVGAVPSFSFELGGQEVALCGISVVDRDLMLTGETLSQGFMVTEDEQFALNVNTREELSRAEALLRRREHGPMDHK